MAVEGAAGDLRLIAILKMDLVFVDECRCFFCFFSVFFVSWCNKYGEFDGDLKSFFFFSIMAVRFYQVPGMICVFFVCLGWFRILQNTKFMIDVGFSR